MARHWAARAARPEMRPSRSGRRGTTMIMHSSGAARSAVASASATSLPHRYWSST
jgi:hypothetical protein